MSAETLRRAATLMRERAEAMTSGAQWTGGNYWITDYDPSDPSGQTPMQYLIGGMDDADAPHFSAWSPAVALAVAAWLDHESHQPETEHEGGYTTGGPCLQALAVANAYLQETP